jgi:hypothetical protein
MSAFAIETNGLTKCFGEVLAADIILILAGLIGLASTFHWWQVADQTR